MPFQQADVIKYDWRTKSAQEDTDLTSPIYKVSKRLQGDVFPAREPLSKFAISLRADERHRRIHLSFFPPFPVVINARVESQSFVRLTSQFVYELPVARQILRIDFVECHRTQETEFGF